jgi:ribosome-binding protein aMBF1 (putative translation factor)
MALVETMKALVDFIIDVCLCGSKREPRRVVRDGLSLLVCDRCGKATRETK